MKRKFFAIIVLIFSAVLIFETSPALAFHITWEQTNGPKGGYSRYIVQDPDDQNVVYVGFGPSQIWKSTDGGETWRQKNNGLPQINFFGGVAANGISALAISEKNPRTLYAGSTIGNIYKTTNGAESWTKVFSFPEIDKTEFVSVSPHDDTLVFAGTTRGMFYVSRDGGNSWSRISNIPIKGSASGGVTFDPLDGATIYFAASYFDIEQESKGSGLFKSTDTGRTWKKIGNGLETEIINKIAINPKDPNNIFVAVGSAFEWGYGTHGLYESADGGETFSKIRKDFVFFQSALPFVAFSKDGERLIVGGLVSGGNPSFFISEDNGKTWKTKTGLWGDFITDVAQFDDPNRFLVTLYWSSLFLTEDGGNTWRDVADFREANLHSVYSPIFFENRVYATAHSNGLFYSDNKGKTWKRILRGDSGTIYEAIIHNYESSASRFSPDLLWLRGEYSSEVVILKNADNPVWRKIDVPGDMAAVLAHPGEAGEAFVGSDTGLYAADYSKLNLTKILNGVNVAVISGNETMLAIGTTDGVHISADGGKTFTKAGLNGKKITAVGVGKNNVYAATENDGVYLDSGEGFTRVNSLTSISQILPDPANENSVYFAKSSRFGVSEIYFSENQGRGVVLEDQGLRHNPTPDPQKLAFSGDGTYLYLATNGMGVWRAKLRDNPLPVAEAVKAEGNEKKNEGIADRKVFRPVFWLIFAVIVIIITIKIAPKIHRAITSKIK